MKLSELWLREWIDLEVNVTELMKRLTMSGLKVNMLEPVSYCFSNVVVGNIVDVQIHPKSSHLWICTIDIGVERLFRIITQSKKYKKDIRIPVALSGAKLPGDVKMQSIKIEGELSEGTLCSLSSLGIVYHGIEDVFELPKDAPIGQDLKDYLNLNDTIIDISIAPNRGDCLSLIGIAHDIGAIYRLPVKRLKNNFISSNINDTLLISVDIPRVCPHYFGRILKNIDISISTPLWMKEKLRRCGITLINVVIDIANYVLLELGQPVHIFDLDTISGNISIRFAIQGEKLDISNDQEIIFTTNDTIIVSDQERPLSIAGILVGNTSIVNTKKTSNIFLESAFFDPLYVMNSAKQYGITTYSSYRYERYGVNPELSKLALERVTFLIINICGGKSGKIIQIIHKDMLPKKIIINLHRVKLDKLLGLVIPDNEVISILRHLGCDIEYNKQHTLWKVSVPVFRFDIKIEEDLIEEIIRLYGYEKIKGTLPDTKFNIIGNNESILSLSRTKALLVDLGYQEVITYSFVHPDMQNLLYPDTLAVTLLNPLTSDMSVMRVSLLIGLLKTLLHNQNRQQKNIRLFEYGRCFLPNKINTTRIYQNFVLSGIMMGSRFDEHWDVVPDALDFYDIKGDIEALLEMNGQLNNVEFKPKDHSALHPGQSAGIFLAGELIGFFGAIHPILEKKLDLWTRTLVFELSWEKILKNKTKQKIGDVPKFPINRRDISIVIPEEIFFGDIIYECKRSIDDMLIDIKLFDIYQGPGVPKGFKSLSIRLYICHFSRTLQEDEIASIIKKCIFILQSKFQASLRIG